MLRARYETRKTGRKLAEALRRRLVPVEGERELARRFEALFDFEGAESFTIYRGPGTAGKLASTLPASPLNTEAPMIFRSRLHSVLFLAASVALAAPSLAGAQGIEEPRIPLRTALSEIMNLREAYAESFNKKDAAAVADMYAPDATAIMSDGTVLNGKDAIRKAFVAEAAKWPHMVITSDTVRVFGHTAWDVGTTRTHPAEGGEQVSQYLVVLRRGLKDWKISSLASVPKSDSAKAAH